MMRSSFCFRVTTALSKPWLSYTASSSSTRAQNHSSMEFDLESPLTNFEDHDNNETQYPPLFLLESDHMISQNYARSLRNMDVNISSRVETISFILQLAGGFDPFLPYLAVNYLDRFFSSQGMPQAKPWVVRLLATACVSLAAKMMKTEFSLQNAQCDEGFIFDLQTIERMELIMLEALKWRLRFITPFSFLDFFISLLKLKDLPSRQALKARAREIIFKAQNEIMLLEFKPSIVAASAVLSASHELFPTQCSCFRKAISTCSYVNKEKLSCCCSVIHGIATEGYELALYVGDGGGGSLSSSDTPANVLDHHSSGCSTTSDLSVEPNTDHPEPRERKTKRHRYNL